MMDILSQFLVVYSVFIMGAISPGPDAIVLLKTAISQGRRFAYFVALGLGTSIFVMTQYILFGMGYLFEKFPVLIYVIQYGGSAFLIFLGIQSLRSSSKFSAGKEADGPEASSKGIFVHFRNGFMTNFLNPFAVLYIISLFAPLVSQPIPAFYKIAFGIFLGGTYATWNSLLSFIPTNKFLKRFFDKYVGVVQKASGVVLIGIGIKYALKSL